MKRVNLASGDQSTNTSHKRKKTTSSAREEDPRPAQKDGNKAESSKTDSKSIQPSDDKTINSDHAKASDVSLRTKQSSPVPSIPLPSGEAVLNDFIRFKQNNC